MLDCWAEDRTEGAVSSLARSRPVSVFLGISASPSWCSRARKPHGAPEGEFLRGGTNSSNPSPSSGESTNLGPGGAPVPVRHLDPWGFPLVPATLIGRLAIDRPYYGQRWSNLLFLDTRNRCSRSEVASFAVIVDALADEAGNFYMHTYARSLIFLLRARPHGSRSRTICRSSRRLDRAGPDIDRPLAE